MRMIGADNLCYALICPIICLAQSIHTNYMLPHKDSTPSFNCCLTCLLPIML